MRNYTREDICAMFEVVRRTLDDARYSGRFSDDEISSLRCALLDGMDFELQATSQNYGDCVMWSISLEHILF